MGLPENVIAQGEGLLDEEEEEDALVEETIAMGRYETYPMLYLTLISPIQDPARDPSP